MSELNRYKIMKAVTDFRRARRKAERQKLLNRILRKSTDLLDYQKISKGLGGIEKSTTIRKEIPLDSIVGSVGRYNDFTRTFLPQKDVDETRWARVQVAMTTGAGVPPIEVYQIGEVYFVLDGNHRVSVARDLGMESIEANVREVTTKAPLSPTDSPEDLIIKIEYANFLKKTDLDKLIPDADLSVSVCGTYPTIEEHISVHRYYMGLDEERKVSMEEAVEDWYDKVYLPIVKVIRDYSLLEDFPGRTETDLYLWLSEHRASLEENLGWKIDLQQAAQDLSGSKSKDPNRLINRVTTKLQDALTPDPIEAGPPAGEWRASQVEHWGLDRMFGEVLVPLNGATESWRALEQAISIAHKESGRVRGLHVVATEEKKNSELARSIQTEFFRRCRAADLEGDFAIDSGGIARKISERARWNDLVVLHLAHPPSQARLAKLSSGIQTLIQRCPTPIFAVKEEISEFKRALLAFDGSPKATEALYVACYTAASWEMALTVIAIDENGEDTQKLLDQANEYLKLFEVDATLIERSGSAAAEIIRTSEDQSCDLIIMGGVGLSPLAEIVLGSAVDKVMRESSRPLLFCR